jgi:hypothetical protein
MKIWVPRKQKILVKLSKNVSPEFAASVLETNAVATEEHDLDFSFCIVNQCTNIFKNTTFHVELISPAHICSAEKTKILIKHTLALS